VLFAFLSAAFQIKGLYFKHLYLLSFLLKLGEINIVRKLKVSFQMAQVGRALELLFGRYRPEGAATVNWDSFSSSWKTTPFDLLLNDLT